MSLFSRSTALEKQREELKKCGIVVNDGVDESDLTTFSSREKMEKSPYSGIVEVLGIELEREPYTPLANSLWMCDSERVEDCGAYVDIIKRLEVMTGSMLGLDGIEDYVNIEEGQAWVEFKYVGKQIRWEAKVENDWMDPFIIVKYDQLLKSSNSPYRIYSNHTDYGQVAFFAAFTAEQFRYFQKLSKIKLALIETQT